MKMILKGGIAVLAVFLLVVCIMDSGTSVIRRNETATLAETATYETLNALKNNSVEINSDQEFIAEVIKNIVLEYDTNSDIVVNIISIDSRNGLLDLEIQQTFTHSNGAKETNIERRTVILEDYKDKNISGGGGTTNKDNLLDVNKVYPLGSSGQNAQDFLLKPAKPTPETKYFGFMAYLEKGNYELTADGTRPVAINRFTDQNGKIINISTPYKLYQSPYTFSRDKAGWVYFACEVDKSKTDATDVTLGNDYNNLKALNVVLKKK